MAKVAEKSALDTAIWEREQTRKQRERIEGNLFTRKEREKELYVKLADLTAGERVELIDLRNEIPLDEQAVGDLNLKESQTEEQISRLTREEHRAVAVAANIAAEQEFRDLMATFETSDLGAWLHVESREAYEKYFAVNKSTNESLYAKRQFAVELLKMIAFGKTL